MTSGTSPLTTRRIITGHDADGKAIIAIDEAIPGSDLAEAPGRTDATFFQLWAVHETPVDLADDAMKEQQKGIAATVVGSGGGTAFRIGILEPGTRSPMHRTQSLDFGICMEGECDMETDNGDSVTVRAGDVVIQRGTNHVWHNRSDKPCKFAWVLIDAQPVKIGDRPLQTNWVPST